MSNKMKLFFQVFFLALTFFELYGFIGLLGIQLSAIPVITLIMSVGVGLGYTVHVVVVSKFVAVIILKGAGWLASITWSVRQFTWVVTVPTKDRSTLVQRCRMSYLKLYHFKRETIIVLTIFYLKVFWF